MYFKPYTYTIMPRFWYILVLCTSLLLTIFTANAQWQADLSGYNISTQARGWQANHTHYYIHAGYLSLNGLESGGLSYLKRSIRLGKECRWRGRVRLEQGVSTQSRAYVLLTSVIEQPTQKTYLALRVDGGRRGGVTLVMLTLQEEHTPKIINEHPLHRSTLQAAHEWRELSYDVSLESSGVISLSLNDHYAEEVARYNEKIVWSEPIEGERSFGVLCLYDGASRRGMHFADFKIEGIDSNSISNPDLENTATNHTPLLLSEVMTYPIEGAVQYVELYNPNPIAVSLKEYSIGIGGNDTQLTYCHLDMLEEVPAESYVVLSNNILILTQAYPRLPWGRERKIDLPHMPTHSGSIRLFHNGTVVSKLDYNPELHLPIFRQRRGVALECNNLEAIRQTSTTANWQSASTRDEHGYASPGYPASQTPEWEQERRSNSLSQLDHIISQAERNNGASLSVSIYTIGGETLTRMLQMDALNYLRRLHSNPKETLAQLPTVYQGVAVLSVILHERIPKRYSLKFIIR